MKDGDLSRDQVFNCDETGLNWRQLPRRTLVAGGETSAKGFKKLKERVTLMACANISGTIAMPLVFIHKSVNPHCFRHVRKEDLPVDYYSQRNAWMNSALFKRWFSGTICSIMQNCTARERTDIESSSAYRQRSKSPWCRSFDDWGQGNYMLLSAPSLIQPMDRVLENIKSLHSRDLLIRVLDEEDTRKESFIEYARRLTVRDATHMASKAWREVTSKQTVAKSWHNSQLVLMTLLNLALI